MFLFYTSNCSWDDRHVLACPTGNNFCETTTEKWKKLRIRNSKYELLLPALLISLQTKTKTNISLRKEPL
jgi:hypothetical protein